MKLILTVRPTGDTLAEGRRIEVERDDYDGAMAVAKSLVEEGEVILHVKVERD